MARLGALDAERRQDDVCIAIAEARGSKVTLDEQFGRDLEEILAGRKPLDTSAWE